MNYNLASVTFRWLTLSQSTCVKSSLRWTILAVGLVSFSPTGWAMTCHEVFKSGNQSKLEATAEAKLAEKAIAEFQRGEALLLQAVETGKVNGRAVIDPVAAKNLEMYSRLFVQLLDESGQHVEMFERLGQTLSGASSVSGYVKDPTFTKRHSKFFADRQWRRFQNAGSLAEIIPNVYLYEGIQASHIGRGLGLAGRSADSVLQTLLNNRIGPDLKILNTEKSIGPVEVYDVEFLVRVSGNDLVRVTATSMLHRDTQVEQLALQTLRPVIPREEVAFYQRAAEAEGLDSVQTQATVMGQSRLVVIPARVLYKAKHRDGLQPEAILNWLDQGSLAHGQQVGERNSWRVTFAEGPLRIKAHFSEDHNGDLLLRSIVAKD